MATSPTSAAVKKNEPVSTQDFGKHVDYFKNAIKATFSLQAEIYRHEPGYVLDLKGVEVGRKKCNDFVKAILYQMNDLKKMFATRRRKIPRTNTQLNKLFYVSDPLISMYEGSDLGPSDPSSKKSPPLVDLIAPLLFEKRMATSGILTSIFSRYVDQNGLKSDNDDQKGRFKADSKMKNALSNTHYTLNGVDLSERELPADLPADKREKIEDNIRLGKKSAFARIDGRPSKRNPDEMVWDKKKGLMYLSIMIFNNYYRIPPALLTEEEEAALHDEENIELAKDLQRTLSEITAFHKS